MVYVLKMLFTLFMIVRTKIIGYYSLLFIENNSKVLIGQDGG